MKCLLVGKKRRAARAWEYSKERGPEKEEKKKRELEKERRSDSELVNVFVGQKVKYQRLSMQLCSSLLYL